MPFLKMLLGILVMPMVLVLVLVVAACLFQIFRRRRTARVLLGVAALMAYLSCTGIAAKALLTPLVRTYTPLKEATPLTGVRFVVVLGSWYSARDELPITASLDYDGLARIIEGVRLFRMLNGAQLVVSGGPPDPVRAPATGYARMARALGVDEASIIVLDDASDTAAEARNVSALLHSAPFILVTSSDHMARALRLMERAGTHPIPAPATRRADSLQWRDFLPTASGLRGTESAFHEYLGLAAISLGLD